MSFCICILMHLGGSVKFYAVPEYKEHKATTCAIKLQPPKRRPCDRLHTASTRRLLPGIMQDAPHCNACTQPLSSSKLLCRAQTCSYMLTLDWLTKVCASIADRFQNVTIRLTGEKRAPHSFTHRTLGLGRTERATEASYGHKTSSIVRQSSFNGNH